MATAPTGTFYNPALDSAIIGLMDAMGEAEGEYTIYSGTYESGKGVPVLIVSGYPAPPHTHNHPRAEHFTFFTDDEWRDFRRIGANHTGNRGNLLNYTNLIDLSLEDGKYRLARYLSQHYSDLGVRWSEELHLSEATDSFLTFLAVDNMASQHLEWVSEKTAYQELTTKISEVQNGPIPTEVEVYEDINEE